MKLIYSKNGQKITTFFCLLFSRGEGGGGGGVQKSISRTDPTFLTLFGIKRPQNLLDFRHFRANLRHSLVRLILRVSRSRILQAIVGVVVVEDNL